MKEAAAESIAGIKTYTLATQNFYQLNKLL